MLLTFYLYYAERLLTLLVSASILNQISFMAYFFISPMNASLVT